MKATLLEGTAEEIRRVLQDTLYSTAGYTVAIERPEESQPPKIRVEGSKDQREFVTAEFAGHALSRLPISKPFKAVLDALYDAYPEWVPLSDLHEAAGYSPAQFAGLMGAFGRRMANTPGYDGDAHFFDWREGAEGWEYRLPDTVHKALNSSMSA